MMNQSLNPIQKHLLPWLNCYLKHFLRCTHTISMRIKIQQLVWWVFLKVLKIPLNAFLQIFYIFHYLPLCVNFALDCIEWLHLLNMVLFDVDPRHVKLSKLDNKPYQVYSYRILYETNCWHIYLHNCFETWAYVSWRNIKW